MHNGNDAGQTLCIRNEPGYGASAVLGVLRVVLELLSFILGLCCVKSAVEPAHWRATCQSFHRSLLHRHVVTHHAPEDDWQL